MVPYIMLFWLVKLKAVQPKSDRRICNFLAKIKDGVLCYLQKSSLLIAISQEHVDKNGIYYVLKTMKKKIRVNVHIIQACC